MGMFTNNKVDMRPPKWYVPFMTILITVLVLILNACTKITIFYPESCTLTEINIVTGVVTETIFYPGDEGFEECLENSVYKDPRTGEVKPWPKS